MIHEAVLVSPRTIPIRPLLAEIIPAIPDPMAIITAINPRNRQPIRSTGRKAMKKKMPAIITGTIMRFERLCAPYALIDLMLLCQPKIFSIIGTNNVIASIFAHKLSCGFTVFAYAV